MTPEFYLTSLVVIATPGTGAIYTVAAGLSGGTRASFVAAFGCAMGIIPHKVVAISGLVTLFYTSVMAFQLLKYLGVIYLLYVAVQSRMQSGFAIAFAGLVVQLAFTRQ